MDCSLPGSSVHGIFQARVLEWGAIAFSEWKIYLNLKLELKKGNLFVCIPNIPQVLLLLLLLLSRFIRVRLCATPQMAAHQAPSSLGFSRQEHWSGLPFPSPMQDSEKVKVKSLSPVQLFATPWTAACQAPPSMGVSRQEHWSGLPLPSPPPGVNP